MICQGVRIYTQKQTVSVLFDAFQLLGAVLVLLVKAVYCYYLIGAFEKLHWENDWHWSLSHLQVQMNSVSDSGTSRFILVSCKGIIPSISNSAYPPLSSATHWLFHWVEDNVDMELFLFWLFQNYLLVCMMTSVVFSHSGLSVAKDLADIPILHNGVVPSAF